MTTLTVFILAGTACCLLSLHRTALRTPPRSKASRMHAMKRRRRPSPEELPRVLRQMAALLAAGRAGPALWDAVAQVLIVEHDRAQQSALPASRLSWRNAHQQDELSASSGTGWPTEVHVNGTLQLVFAVQRASALGLPTASALRHACEITATTRRGRTPGQRPGALAPDQLRMWLDMAACFDVCEASGAPVAAVMQRLANTLEADHDAAALRETALAGPRATVRLLSWLPFLGLGLGTLMGVDPMTALLGSPSGWAVLAAGIGFAAVGRTWSANMITAAARPHQPLNRQRSGARGRLRAARTRAAG